MSRSSKLKKNIVNSLFILIFIAGALILLYPLFSALYYDYQSASEVDDFNNEVAELNQAEIDKRINQAKAYNQSLTSDESLHDFFTESEEEVGKKMYASMLEVNEKIGTVEIPSIEQKLPIFAGTTEEVLQKGVGHLENTSLPVGGKNTHSVLTAHRGLPDKKLFTDLPEVQKGDVFFVKNMKEVLAYKVDKIEVIEPTEFEHLKIEEGKDYVTLLTCTPYMVNSHRLIVRGYNIPFTPELEEIYETETPWWQRFISVYLNYLIGMIIAIILFLIYKYFSKRKRKIKNE